MSTLNKATLRANSDFYDIYEFYAFYDIYDFYGFSIIYLVSDI